MEAVGNYDSRQYLDDDEVRLDARNTLGQWTGLTSCFVASHQVEVPEHRVALEHLGLLVFQIAQLKVVGRP